MATKGFQKRRTLGATGLEVSALGLAASYGVGGRDVERAFDHGINFMYWGALPRPSFGAGVREIARRSRDDMVLMTHQYGRWAGALAPVLEAQLRFLRTEYVDILLLANWSSPPPDSVLDAARALRDRGLVEHIAISCHHRPLFQQLILEPTFESLMVRYNAAHTGAEREVFPHLPGPMLPGPGVIAYTATRWGKLLDPDLVPAGERVPRASDCYRFSLTHPKVDACLMGPRNGADLDEALTALDRGPLSAEEDAWMRRVGRAVRERAAKPEPLPPLPKP